MDPLVVYVCTIDIINRYALARLCSDSNNYPIKLSWIQRFLIMNPAWFAALTMQTQPFQAVVCGSKREVYSLLNTFF